MGEKRRAELLGSRERFFLRKRIWLEEDQLRDRLRGVLGGDREILGGVPFCLEGRLPEQGFRGILGYKQAAGAIGGGGVSIACFRDIFEGDL